MTFETDLLLVWISLHNHSWLIFAKNLLFLKCDWSHFCQFLKYAELGCVRWLGRGFDCVRWWLLQGWGLGLIVLV